MIRFIYCKLTRKKFHIGPDAVGAGMMDAAIDFIVIGPIIVLCFVIFG